MIGEWEPPGLRPPGIIAREPHSRSARVGPTIFSDRRQWTRPRTAVTQARPTRGIDSLHSYSTGTAGRGSRKFENAIEMLDLREGLGTHLADKRERSKRKDRPICDEIRAPSEVLWQGNGRHIREMAAAGSDATEKLIAFD
jgi:hypothetical protein